MFASCRIRISLASRIPTAFAGASCTPKRFASFLATAAGIQTQTQKPFTSKALTTEMSVVTHVWLSFRPCPNDQDHRSKLDPSQESSHPRRLIQFVRRLSAKPTAIS
jgi:hypothetical protein